MQTGPHMVYIFDLLRAGWLPSVGMSWLHSLSWLLQGDTRGARREQGCAHPSAGLRSRVEQQGWFLPKRWSSPLPPDGDRSSPPRLPLPFCFLEFSKPF